MKLNSVIGLLTVFSVLGCTAQKDVKKNTGIDFRYLSPFGLL